MRKKDMFFPWESDPNPQFVKKTAEKDGYDNEPLFESEWEKDNCRIEEVSDREKTR